jgi:dTDP-4-amino-4,6-dideoxygalactose transaminase
MDEMKLKEEIPAILGGRAAVTADHEAANRWPVLGVEEEQAVLDVIRDGNVSTHPVIRELEQDYAEFAGRSFALAHNNGTAALLAAFHALGLRPGDEVLVPSATFWASVAPMLWVGAIPVFCESESDRMGIDPDDALKKITARTKALVAVHLWGLPAKMTKLQRLATEHGLKIIEDASHAHGACWRGRPCGSLGDISVFSLQGDKLAPAGEGGMFLCDDLEYFERAACLGDVTRILELDSPAQRFAATGFGIKTRIAPVSAAIARSQLRRLGDNNRRRNGNVEYLSHALETMGFRTFLPPPHIKRVYFEFMIRHNPETIPLPRDLLVDALRKEGCHVSAPRYPLLHQQPLFTEGAWKEIARPSSEASCPVYDPNALPKTESANETLLRLPSFPNADRRILDQYIHAFRKVVSYSEALISRRNRTRSPLVTFVP